MKVLITGGAGFIGSHTCVEFLQAGHEVVIYDNFENSNRIVVERIKIITGKPLVCVEGDIRDQSHLESLMREHKCDAVVHFAGLKAVGESANNPLDYYENNVQGSISLLKAMQSCGVNKFIFSSSATVYGTPEFLPYTEDHPLRAMNPYGRTKLMVENILRDLHTSNSSWSIAILRYFNPVGAHHSGLIGEDPLGVPNNLMPFITQVATGCREKLSVFGGDYDTRDGTGVRDYIHVEDLAAAHVDALAYLEQKSTSQILNCGYGTGYSVKEVLSKIKEISGVDFPVVETPRREGDPACVVASGDKIREVIGWQPQHNSLDEIVSSALAWEQKKIKQIDLNRV